MARLQFLNCYWDFIDQIYKERAEGRRGVKLCSNGGVYNGFVTAFDFALFTCPEARAVRIGLHICTSCMQLEKRWKAFFKH